MGLNQNSSEIEISSYDGTLSNDQFRVAAFAFAERWNKFNSQLPQCSWIPSPNPLRLSSNSSVDGYLSVENVILAEDNFRPRDDCNQNVDLGCSNSDESIDSAVLVQNQSCEIHYYDFHIVYSTSYKVPVLYFRAHLSDGQPLALHEIEKDIPAYKAEVLKDSKWTFITQEYHPYLNRPWYTLHPCGTSEWMKLLGINDNSVTQNGVEVTKFLVSWFSVVGQIFGLKIPFQMMGSSGV